MKKFKIPYEAKVYGFVVVEAESKEQLVEEEIYADEGEWLEQFDNKSDFDFDLRNVEEEE